MNYTVATYYSCLGLDLVDLELALVGQRFDKSELHDGEISICYRYAILQLDIVCR